jgi:two-component system, sensor histidine kinase and response regulator
MSAKRGIRSIRLQVLGLSLVPVVCLFAFELADGRAIGAPSMLLTVVALVTITIAVLANMIFGQSFAFRLRWLSEQASSFGATRAVLKPLDGGDELGEVSRVIHDVATEIKQRDDVLVRYRLLAEQARDSILFLRRSDAHILGANQAAIRTYGYSMPEILEITVNDLQVSDDSGIVGQQIPQEEIFNITVDTDHRKKDGSTFPVECTMQSAYIDGEHMVLAVIRDLTERRGAEKALREALSQAIETSRLKSEFVATMSHEIRTPINGVIGMTELLLDTPLTRQQHDYAETAMESANSLLGVINNILDFSKIESGHVELDILEFDLLHKIESLGALFSSQAHVKQIGFVTFVDPAIKDRLLGDPTRLRQVLTNLVGNAVKFTSQGCVALSTELVSSANQIAKIRFSVQDTGIGIDAEKVPMLFEAFTQADGSTTREYGGTGLGLAISRNLVERMGGKIEVETERGVGSTFSFTLAFHIASEITGQPDRRDLTGIRALIVDDDAMSLKILSRYLTSWGVHVVTASVAQGGLVLLEKAAAHGKPCDIAIVDLRMPEIDGMQLADKILSTPQLARTRLVLVTAYDGPAQGQAAIRAGFSAYLTKPVRQSQLHDCIADALFGSPGEQPIPAALVAPVVERSGRILVAEDNAVNRQVTLVQLQKLGFIADAATNGSAAVEQTRRSDYDLILMDCHMPIMDGFEATRAIRNRESRTGRHAAIVAMTANALSRDRDQCLAAGMDDHLAKPVSLATMRDVLNRWLPGARENEILDSSRTAELFGDDPAGIREFTATVIPSIGQLCERIEMETDLKALRELAHELKGVSANIGARELLSAATELNTQLQRARSREEAKGSLAGVQSAWVLLRDLVAQREAVLAATP